MATTGSDKVFGRCRCCLKSGYHKDLSKTHHKNGVVYRDLFMDCFNLLLSTEPNLTNLICTSCVRQLNDALEFKIMVAESEQMLLSEICNNDTVFVSVPEEDLHPICPEVLDIKFQLGTGGEEIKEETEEYINEFDDAFDNNETKMEACDNPKTTITYGKMNVDAYCDIPNDELVDGEIELLTRFSANIPRLPNRKALDKTYPAFVKHLKALKGKIILPHMLEKLLLTQPKTIQMQRNLSEKAALIENMATLLENSNLTPFKSKTRTSYPCFYCRHAFENIEKLKEHQRIHKKSDFRKILMSSGPESLVVYVDTTDLKCTICNQDIANINELKQHLTKIHKKLFIPGYTDRVVPFKLSETNIFVCQICGFSLETFGSIERHMNTHYRNYACTECGSGFVTKYRLKVHIKSRHADGAYQCEQCKKIFPTHQKCKNHINTVHKLIKRFKCSKCPERFSEYFRRQKHMEEKHGLPTLLYKCNVCDKSFGRRYTLSRHLKRDHLEERDYQCEICSYKCFTNNELRVHMIKHNGDRTFECGVCNKAYARKKTLREHMRIHANDRRFSCVVCGQAFVQKCSLKGHMKTHHIEYNPVL